MEEEDVPRLEELLERRLKSWTESEWMRTVHLNLMRRSVSRRKLLKFVIELVLKYLT